MEKEQGAPNPLSIADLLGKVMSSPEMMSALTSLLSLLKEPQASSNASPSELPTATQAESTPLAEAESRETMALLPSKPSFSSQKREVLSAIRPYMGERRCQMIDRMVHAADLVQLLKRR